MNFIPLKYTSSKISSAKFSTWILTRQYASWNINYQEPILLKTAPLRYTNRQISHLLNFLTPITLYSLSPSPLGFPEENKSSYLQMGVDISSKKITLYAESQNCTPLCNSLVSCQSRKLISPIFRDVSLKKKKTTTAAINFAKINFAKICQNVHRIALI